MGSARGSAHKNLQECTAPLKNKKLPKHPPHLPQGHIRPPTRLPPHENRYHLQVLYFSFFHFFRQTKSLPLSKHAKTNIVTPFFHFFRCEGEGEIIVLFQNFRFFLLDLCAGTAPQNMGTAPRFWGALPLRGDKTFPKYV